MKGSEKIKKYLDLAREIKNKKKQKPVEDESDSDINCC